jgi:hypothetical protein
VVRAKHNHVGWSGQRWPIASGRARQQPTHSARRAPGGSVRRRIIHCALDQDYSDNGRFVCMFSCRIKSETQPEQYEFEPISSIELDKTE